MSQAGKGLRPWRREKCFYRTVLTALDRSSDSADTLAGLRMLGRWALSGEGRRRPFEFSSRLTRSAVTDSVPCVKTIKPDESLRRFQRLGSPRRRHAHCRRDVRHPRLTEALADHHRSHPSDNRTTDLAILPHIETQARLRFYSAPREISLRVCGWSVA